ncbi:MAG: DUF4239 domain-containing protein, partial [Terriglobales bacterium]
LIYSGAWRMITGGDCGGFMGAFAFGSLLVVGCVVLSLGGMFVVRRLLPPASLREHHEVAGYLLSIVGTLYAVLLGLVIVDVQSKYQEAKVIAETEANAVADMYLLSMGCGDKVKKSLQGSLAQYVELVISEWTEPPVGTIDVGSVVPLRDIWAEMIVYEPVTNKQQALYSTMLTEMGQIADSRRFRIVTSSSSVSPVLWGVLIAGASLTITFTYFFAVESLQAQMLMTVLVAVTISLNVMLVGLFANPYRGDLRIQPVGFMYDRKMIELTSKMEADIKARKSGAESH